MENPEEILQCLEEFSKTKPKDIPRELEEYLSFVAKTGNPVYQWQAIKCLFREKLINVIKDFYESCPSVEIPPCPNVDLFNYEVMKTFILEKLDSFSAAPFTLQRLCELLTTPRKEYNRIDKFMRALEKNIIVVSTVEPGGRRNTENGDSIVNGLESEHLPETSNSSNDINVEEMDDIHSWRRLIPKEIAPFKFDESSEDTPKEAATPQIVQETVVTASKITEAACSSSQDTVITCRKPEEPYVSIEPVPPNTCTRQDNPEESDVSVTITAIPAGVQKRRSSVEPVVSSESTEPIIESSSESETSREVEEPVKEEEPKSDDQETTSSQEIKDADSSSNPEEEEDPIENKMVESSDSSCSTTEDNIELTSSEDTSESSSNEVVTQSINEESQPVPDVIKESVDSVQSNPQDADTIKCSSPIPEPCDEDEVSSSEEKKDDEVDKVESTEPDDNKTNEEELVEPNSSSDKAIEESPTAVINPVEVEEKIPEKEESVNDDSSPMEVDEDFNTTDKVEEVVKADATSDSSL